MHFRNARTADHPLRLSRRHALLAAGAAALSPLAAHAAYPEQIIKLFVGFPPGGGGDLYGRALAAALSKALDKTVLVENRAGANGTIAAGVVAKSKPDGYTLLLVLSGSFSAAPAVKPDLPYRVPEDFIPIAKLVDSPYGLVVSAESPYKTIQEYLQKARQGKMSYASVGAGGASNIVMEMIKQQSGIDILHVPYKGTGNALTDLLGGQVDSFVNPYVPLMPQVKSGKLRLLAITGDKRAPDLPGVPTFKEAGIDVNLTLWYGLVAPAGTPKDVIDKLTDATKQALKDPDLLRVYTADGGQVNPLYGDDYRRLIVRDIEKFKAAVEKGNIKEGTQ
ncbi:MAG: tripartite tricarboxylate transporter substrate binding protein [Pseudomonadota bacterium]